MRKLASIQIIENIRPHYKADRLEIANVLGWEVVIPKDSYTNGDKVVYFETDSLIPYDNRFEFLRKSSLKVIEGKEFIRIRPIKLKNVISFGLAVKIEEYPQYKDLEVGTDLTEKLGVLKMEYEASGNLGDTFGNFYPGLEKTDEPRIQISEEIYTEMIGRPYYITEKIDGTSTTLTIEEIDGNIQIRVFGRNREYKFDEETKLIKYLKQAGILDRAKEIRNQENRDIFIQGELYGEKIQGNKLNKKGLAFNYFNIGYLDTQERVSFDKLVELSTEVLEMVKVLDEGDNFNYTKEQLLEITKGNYEDTENQREGIVIRTKDEEFIDETRLSFKVINPEFALKE